MTSAQLMLNACHKNSVWKLSDWLTQYVDLVRKVIMISRLSKNKQLKKIGVNCLQYWEKSIIVSRLRFKIVTHFISTRDRTY